MFKFFARKPDASTTTAATSGSTSETQSSSQSTLTPPNNSQLRTPSPSEASPDHPPTKVGINDAHSPAPHPPPSPSPAPESHTEHTPASLLTLIKSIPAKTLQSYVITRLKPIAASQDLVLHRAVLSFFSDLAPPPVIHCVRCHKGFCEVENDDRSCLIAHDDESAEVERVGAAKGRGTLPHYETLWGCCGRTVEGDGDQGPPDGWCYEGKHTTDIKRARFRADSTLQDDKLTSCTRLHCHDPDYKRSTRKRRRPVEFDSDDSRYGVDSEGEDGDEELDASPNISSSKKGKGKAKASSARAPTPSESSAAISATAPKRKKPTAKKPKLDAHAQEEDEMAVDGEEGSKAAAGGDDGEAKKPPPPSQKKPRKPRAPKSTAKSAPGPSAAGADVEMDPAPITGPQAVPAVTEGAGESKPAKKRAAPRKSKATAAAAAGEGEIPTDVEMGKPDNADIQPSGAAKKKRKPRASTDANNEVEDPDSNNRVKARMKPKTKGVASSASILAAAAAAAANNSAIDTGVDADAEEDEEDDDDEYTPSPSKAKAKPQAKANKEKTAAVKTGQLKARSKKVVEVVSGSVPGEESLLGVR